MTHRTANIFRLAVKELKALFADRVLFIVIIWAFTAGLYTAAGAMSRELHNAPVGLVDLDQSALSARIVHALYPPYFRAPRPMTATEMDNLMDYGQIGFGIVIPPNFQRDLVAGRHPELQINIDATNMGESFIGSSYLQNIIAREIGEYLNRGGATAEPPIKLVTRVRFNPNLNGQWFGGVLEVINNITMLTIILVGAALIREREHGTIEHLLVMPLTPFEIVAAKVAANGLVVLIAATFGLTVVVQRLLHVPIGGSIPLFVAAAALYLFSTASIGIYLGTVARSMPQLGLLMILILIPLQLLSGGVTPRESMPQLIQNVMLFAPTTHFVRLAQGVLYRGADFSLVWREFIAIAAIGVVFFGAALMRFRRAITQTQI